MGLSLQAYLAYYRGRGTSYRSSTQGTHPDGLPCIAPPQTDSKTDLLWVHADDLETGRALEDLCKRLSQIRPETKVIASGTVPHFPSAQHVDLPPEAHRPAESFAQLWRPSVGIVTGRNLRPAMLSALYNSGTCLIYVDAEDQPFTKPGPRWLPDPTAAVLSLFTTLHTRDAGATRRLRRLGLPSDKLRQSGRLLPAARPPHAPAGGRDDVASYLAGRPIWLAAGLHGSETRAILDAHRAIAKRAHRLLLIIVPSDYDQHPIIRAQIDDAGLRCCDWDMGDEPDDTTSVLITEGPDDLGLWYRIAPLAFLGGTFTEDISDRSPLDAAALGTAILHGPHVKENTRAYTRLSEHLAARCVTTPQDLSAALTDLISPDRSAAMALAGWDVVTEGAGLVDHLCKDISDILDNHKEQTDARA